MLASGREELFETQVHDKALVKDGVSSDVRSRGSSQSASFSGGGAEAKVLRCKPGWHFQKTEWQVCSE